MPTETPVPPAPAVANADASPISFDTRDNTRHAIRVLCDRAGTTVYLKNVITACIEVESNFENYRPDGTPTIHQNKANGGSGRLLSTDWGLCQVNDYYHIGIGKDFVNVAYVMQNPQQVVEWMIKMAMAGFLSMWVSYTSGAYKKYMP